MASFFMTLAPHNDVSGKRGESYVLIPLSARDAHPDFWSWPGSYIPISGGPGDEFGIVLDDLGTTTSTRIYDFPTRREFRFCTDAVYHLGSAAGILEIEHVAAGEYRTAIHVPGSPGFAAASAALTNVVPAPNSDKRWGYA